MRLKKVVLFLCVALLGGLGNTGCKSRSGEVSYEIPDHPTPAPATFGTEADRAAHSSANTPGH